MKKAILFMAIMQLSVACVQKKNPDERELFLKGTKKYQINVNNFKLDYNQALNKIIGYYKNEKGVDLAEAKVFPFSHTLATKLCYIFSIKPHDKQYYYLTGYYVNGFTGEITYVVDARMIPWNYFY